MNRRQALLAELTPGHAKRDTTPLRAKTILVDPGDITRFADRNRFASWTGTAPLDTDGRTYYRRMRPDGKKPTEAMRCLNRRISDAIYSQLVAAAQDQASTYRHFG